MTVFITRCCTNPRPELRRWLPAALCALLAAVALLAAHTPAHAQQATLDALRVERTDEGVFLSARVQFSLPAAVQDALLKGIPMHFVAEADVARERWYWYDRQVASAQRYLRVAYQPLTRRWRLNTAAEPLTSVGQGVSLSQQYDTLDEALAALGRLNHWRIADAQALDGSGRQLLRFRFRLDAGQLPRTLQIGTLRQSDWTLGVERRIDLTPELGQ